MLKNFDIKNWKYKGEKLANPILIIWRITLYPPMLFVAVVYYILLWLSQGKYKADQFLGDYI